LIASADKNQLDKIVIIANTVLGTNCAHTREILETIGDSQRFWVIGAPDIINQKPEFEYYERLLKVKKIIGLKLFPGHEPFYPTAKICQPVYKLALKYQCPVVIHTGINSDDTDCAKYNDPRHIVEIAKQYRDLKIVIAHYFWPKMDYCFAVTKNVPNIYYDTSAMADGEVATLSGGINKVATILEKTIKVKPQGVIFGSDYDMCVQNEHLDLIKKLKITKSERENIFYKNFLACYLP
jgi:predicted TIM-barrel fold metal-dependent hydrolase